MEEKRIKIEKDGPYHVPAGIPLRDESVIADENNDPLKWKEGKTHETKGDYTLCRCGQSGSKPFCDGAHVRTSFDGKETASEEIMEARTQKIEGPEMKLIDIMPLCAVARLCHRCGGTWDLVDSLEPGAKDIATQQAMDCPSGRLTMIDKNTGKAIERDFDPSIGLIEDTPAGVSGPLWVKGGITVESSDGMAYKTRNRQTLCRCGKSRNKPFCDGTHVDIGFKAE